jgi:hypothetical protein
MTGTSVAQTPLLHTQTVAADPHRHQGHLAPLPPLAGSMTRDIPSQGPGVSIKSPLPTSLPPGALFRTRGYTSTPPPSSWTDQAVWTWSQNRAFVWSPAPLPSRPPQGEGQGSTPSDHHTAHRAIWWGGSVLDFIMPSESWSWALLNLVKYVICLSKASCCKNICFQGFMDVKLTWSIKVCRWLFSWFDTVHTQQYTTILTWLNYWFKWTYHQHTVIYDTVY